MSDKLTCSSAEHPARHSLWLDFGEDFPTPEEISASSSVRWPTTSIPSLSSGKTSPASSRRPTTPSDAFWQDFAERLIPSHQDASGQTQVWCLDRNAPLPGAFSMLNFSEWPSAAGGSLCSLSEVLETGPLPERFFLSAKACSGILRRAEKRGKQLPAPLMQALVAVAEQELHQAQLRPLELTSRTQR